MQRKVILLTVILASASTFVHAEDAKHPSSGLEKTVIVESIAKNISEISACYSNELKKSKGPFSGSILTKFTIEADGLVKSAVAEDSSLQNEAVKTCVINVLKRIQFPKPAGGGVVEVNYPFAFTPATAESTKRQKKAK